MEGGTVVRRLFAGVIAAVSPLSVGLPEEAPGSPPITTVGVYAAGEYVEGFPMIVGLRFEGGTRPGSAPTVVNYDLAMTATGPATYLVLFEGENGRTLTIGSLACGYGEGSLHPRLRWIEIPCGNDLVVWLDVAQLASANPSDLTERHGFFPRKRPFPLAGRWHVLVSAGITPRQSRFFNVVVREATADERGVASALAADGLGRSWFPAVVLRDDPLPAIDHLPPVTRRIVELIGVLRAARRSAEEGLDAVRQAQGGWGYLERLVDLVEYECRVEIAKTDSSDEPPPLPKGSTEGDLAVAQIADGNGLVAQLRAITPEQVEFIRRYD